MDRQEAEKWTILRSVTGSHAYGLNTPTSDIDKKAIVIEPLAHAWGFGKPWDGQVYSQSGEQDFEVFGVRKFLHLALKGNPTVTELLFIKPEKTDARGVKLQELYPLIVSRQAGKAYKGYLHAQRLRLTGERGNAGHGPFRADLIAKHGFDTKFAMHMLRLGVQGVELLTTGRLHLPISESDRSFLLGVRNGMVPLDQCLRAADQYEHQLDELTKDGPIQEYPDAKAVEAWMLELYIYNWKAHLPHSVKDSLIGWDLIEHAQRAGYDVALGRDPRDGRRVSVQISASESGLKPSGPDGV